ncbi:MAG TPA: hypothetical protein VF139_15830 [Candidatus Polarisedimenticolaceae bacterium]
MWQRFSRHLTWLEIIDLVLYGGLGLALLGYAIYSLGQAMLKAGNHLGLLILSALIVSSVLSLIRDLRKKYLSVPSKLLLGAWALCVAVVVIAELLELGG